MDGFAHIFVVGADGSRNTQLTDATRPDGHPTWSTDGSHIAFVRGAGRRSHLFVMAADGTDVTRITSGNFGDQDPVWSPYQDELAFSSTRGGGRHLFTLAPDGTNIQQITTGNGWDGSPGWMALGDRIVFVRDGNGNHTALETVDVVLGSVTAVTDGSAKDSVPAWQPVDEVARSYDAAAKDELLRALAAARTYWQDFGTYTGLNDVQMELRDPGGRYVNASVLSEFQATSAGGSGNRFVAARISDSGGCFFLVDQGAETTIFGAHMSSSFCMGDWAPRFAAHLAWPAE
jgi:dipeptidyl aminopeptidase/acylaminoacyl peptidase